MKDHLESPEQSPDYCICVSVRPAENTASLEVYHQGKCLLDKENLNLDVMQGLLRGSQIGVLRRYLGLSDSLKEMWEYRAFSKLQTAIGYTFPSITIFYFNPEKT